LGFGICSGSGNGNFGSREPAASILKSYLSLLVVGNGNGRAVICFLAGIAGFIVKVTTG